MKILILLNSLMLQSAAAYEKIQKEKKSAIQNAL